MRSMQLNKRTKKSKYDKILRPEGRTVEAIEQKIWKIYESFNTKEKSFIEDASQAIKVLAHTIFNEGEEGKINPYGVLQEHIIDTANRNYRGTLEMIFSEFRNQRQQLYNRYNSYMFRRGEKGTQYFYQNAELEQGVGSVWEISVELPEAPIGKVSYTNLYIEFDFSGGTITEAIMS